MLPIIPSRAHAVLDYLIGAALIILPLVWIEESGAAAWVPMVLGAGIIVYSLMTAYELSIAKIIPLPVHLMLDMGGGVLLAVSPWLFGFADAIWAPHVVIGVMEIGIAALSKRVPEHAIVRHTA